MSALAMEFLCELVGQSSKHLNSIGGLSGGPKRQSVDLSNVYKG